MQDQFEVKTFFFLEITMILEEKSERPDQSSFSFLENIKFNFLKSLPRAPEFEYPPLLVRTLSEIKLLFSISKTKQWIRCLFKKLAMHHGLEIINQLGSYSDK